MKPVYIFDLDGTLALCEHRLAHIQTEPKDWPAFYAACVDDKPNTAVIRTLQQLRSSGAEIWVWTGRSDEVKLQTIDWLMRYGCLDHRMTRWWPNNGERFRMRKAGDHRPDHELKAEWLSEIEPPEYRRITAAFEDRDRVVAMWRDANIPCFQVAPGTF
jgi:phosphoglycolate phosphatase-like HAD superfamily hydrolase